MPLSIPFLSLNLDLVKSGFGQRHISTPLFPVSPRWLPALHMSLTIICNSFCQLTKCRTDDSMVTFFSTLCGSHPIVLSAASSSVCFSLSLKFGTFPLQSSHREQALAYVAKLEDCLARHGFCSAGRISQSDACEHIKEMFCL